MPASPAPTWSPSESKSKFPSPFPCVWMMEVFRCVLLWNVECICRAFLAGVLAAVGGGSGSDPAEMAAVSGGLAAVFCSVAAVAFRSPTDWRRFLVGSAAGGVGFSVTGGGSVSAAAEVAAVSTAGAAVSWGLAAVSSAPFRKSPDSRQPAALVIRSRTVGPSMAGAAGVVVCWSNNGR